MFIDYGLDARSGDLSAEFTLGDCLSGTVKLTKTADSDKYGYSGSGNGFDSRSQFSLDGELDKNVIIFCVDDSLSWHVNNIKKNAVVEGPTNGLDDKATTAETQSKNLEKKFVWVYPKMEPAVFCMLMV